MPALLFCSHSLWSAYFVLWEDIIDKVDSGKSYRFNNCKIRIFDDHKYINTNEFTKITEIEDIKNVNMTSPQIQEHMISAKWAWKSKRVAPVFCATENLTTLSYNKRL